MALNIGKLLSDPLGAVIDLGADLLGLPPQVKHAAKVAASAVTGNVVALVQNGIALAHSLVTPPAVTEYCPPPAPPPGYAPASGGAGGGGGVGGGAGAVDPNARRFVSALRVLEANFPVFDAGGGRIDGFVTKASLEEVLKSPCASSTLQGAARFLIDHPEYFHRLDTAAGIGWRDGVVGLKDVRAALRQAQGQLWQAELPSTGTWSPAGSLEGGTATATPSTSLPPTTSWQPPAVLERSMSVEERIQAILLRIADETDREMLQVVGEMDQNAARRSGASGAQAQQLDHSQEKLQLKLQRLIERRRQMFDLMSNVSQKFHEMAKTAIQNLARA
jgi:hypothetical protein